MWLLGSFRKDIVHSPVSVIFMLKTMMSGVVKNTELTMWWQIFEEFNLFIKHLLNALKNSTTVWINLILIFKSFWQGSFQKILKWLACLEIRDKSLVD